MRVEGLKSPPKVIEATKQYREESDTIGLFVKECLIKNIEGKTLMKTLHADYYSKWCLDYGYTPMNSRNLSNELRRRGMKVDVAHSNKLFLFGYDTVD